MNDSAEPPGLFAPRPRRGHGPHRRRRPTFGHLAVVLAAVAGVALRLLVLHSRLGTIDSDEAVVGLMGRHLGVGGWRAFYWGQPYGGTIEPVLAGAVFRLVGSSVLALKAVPVALDAVAALLTWRLGRHLGGRRTGVLAGLLVWLWPGTYVWWSVKERGFYEAGLCLTLLVALAGVRLVAREGHSWVDWVLLGLAGGLGWWQTPQVVYVAAPVAAWLVWHLRLRSWRALAALPAFAVGALPWLWPNLHDGFTSLRPPPSPVKGTYTDHLVTLAKVGGPMTLGLRVPYLTRWLHPTPVAQAAYLVLLAVVATGCARRWRGGRLVALVVICLPFLHAILPLAGTVAEGRYTLFALPWLALALAHRCTLRPVAVAAVVLATGLSLAGLSAMRGQTDPYAPDRHVPRSLSNLRRGLEAHGLHHAWANYWVAYRLTFETREHIVAAPASSDRYAPYARAVAGDPRAAHVFMSGSHTDAIFHADLDARHLAYQRFDAGPDWVIYVPASPVGPTDFDNTYP